MTSIQTACQYQRNRTPCLPDSLYGLPTDCAGDESVKKANEQRAKDRLMNDFKQFKQQRVAQAALECERQLRETNTQLMQVTLAELR